MVRRICCSLFWQTFLPIPLFSKKKLPFCPLSCGFKSPPKFNSPFLHKELQLTHPKFQFRRRHLKPKEADFRVFRPEVRPPGSGDYISVNGIFFGWICKVSGEFIHEWNEQKEYLEPGLYTPQKRKDIHRSVFGMYIYIYVFWSSARPPSMILAPRLVVHLQRIHPRRLT